jgi:hypothetical protein
MCARGGGGGRSRHLSSAWCFEKKNKLKLKNKETSQMLTPKIKIINFLSSIRKSIRRNIIKQLNT